MFAKQILFFLIILIVGNNFNDEVVSWDDNRKLTWKDFRGVPDESSDAVALTASGITFGFSVKTNNGNVEGFTTSIASHFYPNKSWYFKEKVDGTILKHEQLHFDITELYARKLREQVSKLKPNRNIKKQLNSVHSLILQELNKEQNRYDEESEHSLNTIKQKKWEDYIARELQALVQFKSQ